MPEEITHNAIVEAVRLATEDVFATMLSLPVKCGDARQTPKELESFDGVIAVVGIGGHWTGTGRISLTPQLACKLAGALVGCSFDAVNEEVLDAVAEVSNMIVGNVKTFFEEQLGPLGLSVPTVIFGRNYRTRSAGVTNWSVIPFFTGSEEMEVHFCLMPTKQAHPVHREVLQTA